MPTVMSVFGVEPFRIGGTETFARELSLQLSRIGWDSVLCFQSTPPKDVLQFLQRSSVRFDILPHSHIQGVQPAREFVRALRRHRPQVVHLHYSGFIGAYPWLARMLAVEKVFFTDHSSRPTGYTPRKSALWKRIVARAINAPIAKVISVSQYGYRCLTALDLLPRSRYVMIYNGVDLSRVQPSTERARAFRTRHQIPDDRFVVLQVSWIIPEKGIPALLKAARLVLATNSDVQFVFVGEGAYRQQYMAEAATAGLADHITWTGLVQDPFHEGVFDAADVVCQVSNWEEVFGWTIAEAMAYSRPIVGTRVGGIPELIIDGESGLLVDRDDSEAIAAKLLMLAADSALRSRMGHVGAALVEQKFNLERNVAQLIRQYDLTPAPQADAL